MPDRGHLSSEQERDNLIEELGEAHINVHQANEALVKVVAALGDTRQILRDYMNYFRAAVVVGLIAVSVALGAGYQQYQINAELEQAQVALEYEQQVRAYEDCQQTNRSRTNIIETFSLLGEGFLGDNPETDQTLNRFIQALGDRFPQISCGEEPVNPDASS